MTLLWLTLLTLAVVGLALLVLGKVEGPRDKG